MIVSLGITVVRVLYSDPYLVHALLLDVVSAIIAFDHESYGYVASSLFNHAVL
jgi:hypothetical protein